MADTETSERTTQSNGGNGSSTSGAHDTRKAAVRAAVIAAASGATAFAAKKAFSGRGSNADADENGEKKPARKGNDSMLSTMMTSGWGSAREQIVPMLEDAANQAGRYVAKSAPELVSETLVPEFIRGFEGAKNSRGDDDEE